MSPMYWALIGLLGLILLGFGLRSFVLGGFQRGGSGDPAEGSPVEVPMAPLQKRAWWGLGIGVVISAALAAVVIAAGPENYSQDRGTRLLTYGIFLAGVVGYLIVIRLTRGGEAASGILLDERDRAILSRALVVSLVTGFLTLTAWAVALTEVYWEARAIPIDVPSFIWWSTFIAALLGREVGILMGYAGWHSHGEG
ncbi:MAG: hypothetical protein JSU87_04445 [Gemmatimonadota bacterium]|nr:MAG: hypothetical protein JSU87_04445 [Gemmatimonadota bacterium]